MMIFAITLSYLRSAEELKFHAESHKQWLAENIASGKVIFAGPITDGSGGYILGRFTDRDEMTSTLAADPFVSFGLVEAGCREITAAICAEEFGRYWAEDAKAIPVTA
jgi:uncharacterized protein YciI